MLKQDRSLVEPLGIEVMAGGYIHIGKTGVGGGSTLAVSYANITA